jgi:hypothetical protein
MPDSLLQAAKKVARKANLPWPLVQKTYRALQEAGHLPTSSGRAVYNARPEYIAKLILALATPGLSASAAIKTFWHSRTTSENPDHLVELGEALTYLLVDGSDVEMIQINPSTRDSFIDGGGIFGGNYISEIEDNSQNKIARYLEEPLISQIGAIMGELLVALAESISWDTEDEGPGPSSRAGQP